MKKAKHKKKILTEEQKRERANKREKRVLKNKIFKIFTDAGFTYLSTGGKEGNVGYRTVEVDSMFIYENIWILCEDTIAKNDRDHIRTKNEAFGEIKQNLSTFIIFLKESFPDKAELLNKYDLNRIKIFCLYIPRDELDLNDNDYHLFSNLIFVQPKTLNYFKWIVGCIKRSAIYEIFKFLKLENDQVGFVSSSTEAATIKAPIIYPREFTGIQNGVRLVSFMMSAEDLLSTCYVLRKDNWSDSIWLYQRLIEKSKIKKIREFLERKGEAFYNNIIVALPDNVSFQDAAGNFQTIDQIASLEGNCKLIIPKEMNSVCIIDGQHRVYAHYESGVDSKQERTIASLRPKLHLLVTGLIFPKGLSSEQRAKIQSEIFLDINSNTKAVPQNVLLQIKRIKNPLDSESIAQFVIERLNRFGVFQRLLQLSSLDKAKIKTASIVKFALRYLVTVDPLEGKNSLVNHWGGDKYLLMKADDTALNDYVKFCATIINQYFSAIKNNFKNYWEDDNSKLLSVISVNGFIIALTRQLKRNGIKDFNFYNEKFKNWQFDFSNENFPYTSSQYHKFSTKILKEVFEIEE